MTWICRRGKLPYGRVVLSKLKIIKKISKVGILFGLIGYLSMLRQVIGAMLEMRIFRRKRFVESSKEISDACGPLLG